MVERTKSPAIKTATQKMDSNTGRMRFVMA
jgi:hypothetical protein